MNTSDRIIARLLGFCAILTIWCGPYATEATGQTQNTLKFVPEVLDFGIIREANGKVSARVKAVNVSDKTTYIISARTSCGCSGVEYDDTPLAPGDSTEITITYDPTNRPGKFLKTAKIYTGEEREGNSFKLKGTVIPSGRNLDRAYPVKAGELRLSTMLVNAGEIGDSETRPLFVGIYNDSDRPLAIKAASDAAPMDANVLPDSIEPYGISAITLMLHGRDIRTTGPDFNYNAYIINAATGDTITRIPVGGTIRRTSTSK